MENFKIPEINFCVIEISGVTILFLIDLILFPISDVKEITNYFFYINIISMTLFALLQIGYLFLLNRNNFDYTEKKSVMLYDILSILLLLVKAAFTNHRGYEINAMKIILHTISICICGFFSLKHMIFFT